MLEKFSFSPSMRNFRIAQPRCIGAKHQAEATIRWYFEETLGLEEAGKERMLFEEDANALQVRGETRVATTRYTTHFLSYQYRSRFHTS